MTYKLAVFDVDGTLISSKSKILLPSTIDSLKLLQAKGMKIAIASGRPYFALDKRIIEKIDFDYFVCSNGNNVRKGDGSIVYRYEMVKKDVESLTKDFIEKDDAIFFQFLDKIYVYNHFDICFKTFMDFVGMKEIIVDNTKERNRHLKDLPLQAVGMIKKENVEYYRKKYPQYKIEHFGDAGYDIYDEHISKAVGIQHLCESMKISMDDVIAFGDHNNDVDMLEACGCGVAMGDGNEQAKNSADFITLSSDEGGIYHACKTLKLI